MLSSARIGTVRPFLTNQPGSSINNSQVCKRRVIKKFAVPPIEVVELGTNVSQPAHHLCFWVPLRFCNCIISCPAHIIVLKPCLSVWGRFIVSRYQILGGWRLRSADHFFLSFFFGFVWAHGRVAGTREEEQPGKEKRCRVEVGPERHLFCHWERQWVTQILGGTECCVILMYESVGQNALSNIFPIEHRTST